MLLICAYCSTYLHKMRYYLIAGEPSGDMHGANLMRSLKAYDQQAQFRYYGGDKMEAEGGTLVCHYRDTAVMGFVRVITHYPLYFVISSIVEQILLPTTPMWLF